MELERMRNGVRLNPELEAIRNKVLRESTVNDNDWIQELIRRTSGIHAGFLFHEQKILQNLCLFVSETQNKLSCAGWELFGYHLGLNPCVLKVINHNNFNKEDPTYNTLLAFVQFDDATIGKIIQALWDIGRLDVITRLRKSLNDLADIISQHRNNSNFNTNSGENSDYGSLQLSNEGNILNSGSDSDILEDNNGNLNILTRNGDIIKPVVVPPAPFIFQNIKATPEYISQRIQQSLNSNRDSLSDYQSNGNIQECYANAKIIDSDVPYTTERIQTSAVHSTDAQNNVKRTKKRYGKIILLTFATDGEKYADEICKILRRDRDNYPKIGVLVLSEHAKEVMKDPHRFITGVFHQVDYICPILTESYFNLIRRKEKSTNYSDLHLDARYVQYIYALMSNYYVSNGCLNDKIRCIIPDQIVSKIRCNLIASVPIFSAWVRSSEVDEMAVRLLKSKV